MLELRALPGNIALFGADDAGGHGRLEAERRTDCHGPIAYLNCIGIPDLRGYQILLAEDANHGEVRRLIDADYLGFILHRIVGEFHLDSVGLVDHVIVRQDVTVIVHHYSGTRRRASGLSALGHPVSTERIAEKAVKEIVHAAVTVLFFILRDGTAAPV